ncbi:hypothetical protein MTO96_018751 [Rhipicephalus appendiculatus]
MVDTLPPLYVPNDSGLGATRPAQEPRVHSRNTSTTALPEMWLLLQSYPQAGKECTSLSCRSLGQWIRAKLDYSVDPCKDFYAYVCNTFRGRDEFTHIHELIRLFTELRLLVPFVPESNQLSWQKATGMYRACLNFVSSFKSETYYLVEWMKSLNLDLMNETRLATVNPVEMMVRCSLDLRVYVVISIVLADKDFRNKKRLIQLGYSDEQITWRGQDRGVRDYIKFLTMYGVRAPMDEQLASKIKAYEEQMDSTERALFRIGEFRVFIPISQLGQQTTPYVTPDEWGIYFSKYTDGTYGGSDQILYQPHITRVLATLFKDEYVGRKGLQYLVAWIVFRQLVEFTEPDMFLRDRTKSDACYEHIKKVMNLAVTSPVFQSEIPLYMIGKAKDMVSNIRSAFQKAFESSSWIGRNFREAAIRKLNNITAYVGSPGKQLDPEYVEAIYKPYPDAPLDRLFPTWIKALALSSHLIWSDQTTPLFQEQTYSSYYSRTNNDFTILTIELLRPFAYSFGPIALNYGGLGMSIGHELMHAFDVQGIRSLERDLLQGKEAFLKEYTKRALCLRNSHRSVLSLTGGEEKLNYTLDSENLADLVGVKIAYQAFASLMSPEKTETLVGLDMSPVQLFFVNYCVTWCAQLSETQSNYAPFRSRCIVPLMNMPEFSRAFRCTAGAPMNPPKKCDFW